MKGPRRSGDTIMRATENAASAGRRGSLKRPPPACSAWLVPNHCHFIREHPEEPSAATRVTAAHAALRVLHDDAVDPLRLVRPQEKRPAEEPAAGAFEQHQAVLFG